MKRLILLTVALGLSFTTAAGVYGGAVGGPRVAAARAVPAYGSLTFEVTFRGGEAGRVALRGDHDTDLDLYVYDEDGRLVDSDDDYSDTCYATWYTPYTQVYTIRVVNRGSVYNEMNLVTN